MNESDFQQVILQYLKEKGCARQLLAGWGEPGACDDARACPPLKRRAAPSRGALQQSSVHHRMGIERALVSKAHCAGQRGAACWDALRARRPHARCRAPLSTHRYSDAEAALERRIRAAAAPHEPGQPQPAPPQPQPGAAAMSLTDRLSVVKGVVEHVVASFDATDPQSYVDALDAFATWVDHSLDAYRVRRPTDATAISRTAATASTQPGAARDAQRMAWNLAAPRPGCAGVALAQELQFRVAGAAASGSGCWCCCAFVLLPARCAGRAVAAALPAGAALLPCAGGQGRVHPGHRPAQQVSATHLPRDGCTPAGPRQQGAH